ncbi:MAG: hypothetical protein JWP58_65 [Hymenobacter sp.]|nr:hypothetical protein [Hymenobacter sp.]
MKQFYLRCFLIIAVLSSSGFLRGVVYAQCPVAANCTPGHASNSQAASFGMGIFNVALGSINNTTAGTTDGYQNYGCTLGTTLNIGQAYPISITTNANVNENVRVWLDWNNNGAFDPATELIFSSNSARVHAGLTVAIPLGAVTGQPLRLRVAADGATVPLPTPCSTPQYSQVEDYRVTLLANTQVPGLAFSIGATQACAGTFAFRDQSSRQPTSWRWTFGDGTSSTQQQPTHTYAQAGTYTVQLRACNAVGCDSSQQEVTFFATYPVAASCQPATLSYCCNYGITRVDFGDLSQTSADGQAGYEDYSCARRTTVAQGQVVPLHITTAQPQDTWVYLDANNDGLFAAGELLYQALNRPSPQDFVTVPRTTLTNQPLRLRVISDAAGTANGATSPCVARTSGQVEDYTVVVTPVVACPATVQAGQITHVFSAGLAGAGVDTVASALLLTGYPTGATLQWERSANTTPAAWQVLPGSVRPTRFYSRHRNSPDSLYRVAVSCAGTTAYTATVQATGVRGGLGGGNCAADFITRVALTGTLLDNPSVCVPTKNGYLLSNPSRPTQTATVLWNEVYQLLVTTSRTSRVAMFVGVPGQPMQLLQDVITAPNGGLTSLVLPLNTLSIPAAPPVLLLRLRCVDPSPFHYPLATRPITYDELLYDGETEDYVLRVAPFACPTTPVTAGLLVAPAGPQCARNDFTLRLNGFTPGATLQWQSSADSLSWQNISTPRSELTTRLTATTYYRVQAQGCSGLAVTTPAVGVHLLPMADCYCPLSTATVPATGPVIARVQLLGTRLDNASPAIAGGPRRVRYAPTTPSQTAEVVRGATYTLALTVANTPATGAAVHAAAWLDLDRNGFYDSLEWVHLLRTPAASGSVVYQATLPVAASAQLGTTALRVRVGNNVSYRPTLACEAGTGAGEGEMEDYTLTIIAPPCGAALTAGSITPVPAPNGRTRLRSVGYTLGTDLQWQRSADSLAWNDITGAVTDEYPVWFVSAHYYRLRVQCGGTTAYSRAVQARQPGQPVGCVQYGPQNRSGDFCYVDDVEIGGTPLVNIGSRVSTSQWNYTAYTPGAGRIQEAVGYWPPQQQGFTATLVRGNTYPLRLTGFGTVQGGINQPVTIGAWVDWNQDGTFAPGEYYGQPSTTYAAGRLTFTGPLAVPATAALGTVLMRVRAFGGLLPTDGCQIILSGETAETEDYLLTVADQPALVVPTLTASLCTGQPLRLESTSAGAGATYRWLGPNGFQATGAVATRAAFTTADAGTYIAVAERAGERLVTSLYVPAAPSCLPVVSANRTPMGRPSLAIFPNPTTGRCTIQLAGTSTRPLQVLVRNALGQVVATPSPEARSGPLGQEILLDLRGLAAGLYVIELRDAQGSLFGKVLVK